MATEKRNTSGLMDIIIFVISICGLWPTHIFHTHTHRNRNNNTINFHDMKFIESLREMEKIVTEKGVT